MFDTAGRQVVDSKMMEELKIIAKKFKFIRILIYSIKNKYKIFQNFNLNKNSLIIDIGANQGEVSQYFLDQFSCKIEAYEPNPHAFEKLSNRFRYNNNVKCYNKGVSTNHSNRKLYHHKDYDINNLVNGDMEDILLFKPEIIIIGTGESQIIPANEIINFIHSKKIGLEFMITEAACKTFNLLISEGRKVVAGLIV